MILLRGQQLTDDDLLAFSRRFGELDPPPNQERGRISPPGYPDIYVVSNVLDAKGDPIGALGAGEAGVAHRHELSRRAARRLDAARSRSRPAAATPGLRHAGGVRRPARGLCVPKSKAAASSTTGPTIPAATCAKGVTPTDDPMAAPRLASGDPEASANGRATLYLGRRRNSHVEGYSRAESGRRARGPVGARDRSPVSSTSMSGGWATW